MLRYSSKSCTSTDFSSLHAQKKNRYYYQFPVTFIFCFLSSLPLSYTYRISVQISISLINGYAGTYRSNFSTSATLCIRSYILYPYLLCFRIMMNGSCLYLYIFCSPRPTSIYILFIVSINIIRSKFCSTLIANISSLHLIYRLVPGFFNNLCLIMTAALMQHPLMFMRRSCIIVRSIGVAIAASSCSTGITGSCSG